MRAGALFAGMGGLELGISQVLPIRTQWVSEFDVAPSRVLDARFGVPNLGDITRVDWSAVDPVELVSGGSPCQDISEVGARAGMTEGTRSNLWVAMRQSIEVLKPRLVIWENVRGAYFACADSAMGRCPRCMGRGGPHRPYLRPIGRVLGDLSELGFDAVWTGISAAQVGAPHIRPRVFVLAWQRDYTDDIEPYPMPGRLDRERNLLPTPVASMSKGPGGVAATLRRQARGYGLRLDEFFRVRGLEHFAEAVALWEQITSTPAPPATAPTGPGGDPQVSPEFVEWMMGLPAGWTDAEGVSRSQRLKMLGNGVQPMQAAQAVSELLTVRRVALGYERLA
jgi:DNA (cytosine-5)-methyltransferase 1